MKDYGIGVMVLLAFLLATCVLVWVNMSREKRINKMERRSRERRRAAIKNAITFDQLLNQRLSGECMENLKSDRVMQLEAALYRVSAERDRMHRHRDYLLDVVTSRLKESVSEDDLDRLSGVKNRGEQ